MRDHELIDYIEPRHVWYRPGGSALLTPEACCEDPQTTPIGAEAVSADQVWWQWTGTEVTVGIIDPARVRGHRGRGGLLLG